MAKTENYSRDLDTLQVGILNRLSKIKERALITSCPSELIDEIEQTEKALDFTRFRIQNAQEELGYGVNLIKSLSENLQGINDENIKLIKENLESMMGECKDVRFLERELALNTSAWASNTVRHQGLAIKLLRKRGEACIEMLHNVSRIFENGPNCGNRNSNSGCVGFIGDLKTLAVAGKKLNSDSEETPDELEPVVDRLRELDSYSKRQNVSFAIKENSSLCSEENEYGSSKEDEGDESDGSNLLITKGINSGKNETHSRSASTSSSSKALEERQGNTCALDRGNDSAQTINSNGDESNEVVLHQRSADLKSTVELETNDNRMSVPSPNESYNNPLLTARHLDNNTTLQKKASGEVNMQDEGNESHNSTNHTIKDISECGGRDDSGIEYVNTTPLLPSKTPDTIYDDQARIGDFRIEIPDIVSNRDSVQLNSKIAPGTTEQKKDSSTLESSSLYYKDETSDRETSAEEPLGAKTPHNDAETNTFITVEDSNALYKVENSSSFSNSPFVKTPSVASTECNKYGEELPGKKYDNCISNKDSGNIKEQGTSIVLMTESEIISKNSNENISNSSPENNSSHPQTVGSSHSTSTSLQYHKLPENLPEKKHDGYIYNMNSNDIKNQSVSVASITEIEQTEGSGMISKSSNENIRNLSPENNSKREKNEEGLNAPPDGYTNITSNYNQNIRVSDSSNISAELSEVQNQTSGDQLSHKSPTNSSFPNSSECSGNLKKASLNSEKNTKYANSSVQSNDSEINNDIKIGSSLSSVCYNLSTKDTGRVSENMNNVDVEPQDEHTSQSVNELPEPVSSSIFKADSSRDFRSAKSNRSVFESCVNNDKEKQNSVASHSPANNAQENIFNNKYNSKTHHDAGSFLKRLIDVDIHNEYPGIFMNFENSKMPSLEPPEVLELLNIYRTQVAAAVLERDRLSKLTLDLGKKIEILESRDHSLRFNNTSKELHKSTEPLNSDNADNLKTAQSQTNREVINVESFKNEINLDYNNRQVSNDKTYELPYTPAHTSINNVDEQRFIDDEEKTKNTSSPHHYQGSLNILNKDPDCSHVTEDNMNLKDGTSEEKQHHSLTTSAQNQDEPLDTAIMHTSPSSQSSNQPISQLLLKKTSLLQNQSISATSLPELTLENVIELLLPKSQGTSEGEGIDNENLVIMDTIPAFKNQKELENFIKVLTQFYAQLNRKLEEQCDAIKMKDDEIIFLRKLVIPEGENLFAHSKALELQVESLLKQLVSTEFELSRSKTEIQETREALEILEGYLLIEKEKNNHINTMPIIPSSNSTSSRKLKETRRKQSNRSASTIRFSDDEALNYKNMMNFVSNPKKYKLEPNADDNSLISAVKVRTNLPKSVIEKELYFDKPKTKRKEIHSGLRKQSLGWKEHMNSEYNRASTSKKFQSYFDYSTSGSMDKPADSTSPAV